MFGISFFEQNGCSENVAKVISKKQFLRIPCKSGEKYLEYAGGLAGLKNLVT